MSIATRDGHRVEQGDESIELRQFRSVLDFMQHRQSEEDVKDIGRLNESQFLFLATLYRQQKSNVYSIYKHFVETAVHDAPAISLQAAYRAADALVSRGVIDRVGTARSKTNKSTMPIYGVTQPGVEVLRQEVEHRMRVTFSFLPEEAD